MNSTPVEAARRSDTWCGSGVDYSYHGVTHGDIRSQILEAACRARQLDEKGQVGRLEFLAGRVVWGKLDFRNDVTRVANKIGDSRLSFPIKNWLIKMVGRNVRQANAGGTSSLGLALEVATARVMDGAPCGSTAVEHGLQYTVAVRSVDPQKAIHLKQAENLLQLHAVRGPAGERVEHGESCSIVAREHQIFRPEPLEELESRAMRSVGREMVDRGETFENIVNALGITLGTTKERLRFMINPRERYPQASNLARQYSLRTHRRYSEENE
ncbi:hypothetical protein BamIOP4010DRAFT_3629 [Burkholderia ambifaria IOP40-10]|uniref:Uncharacterized protein n=1 Tax=Burkholderia ambifaria IOP40-10 TaxID=396596 RepID=B1FHW9_9BURK|nr:hypothetical protein [Burkholderia ambifaria]EDT02840.1 hypothetical protein BamIOP4010DRAFT_3629 [Burkholderia ambifaria IOP40-10]